MEEKLHISSPWVTYVHKLQCLFGDDPDIRVEYDDDACRVKLFVNGIDKAEALTRLLKPEVEFGNVKLYIEVIPANREKTFADLVKDAFLGNPHFVELIKIPLQSNPIYYAIFKKEVAQFFNDNLADAHGNISTLYETMAKEILGEEDGVHFCTDNE